MWWVFWPALVLSVTSAIGGVAHKQVRTGCNTAVVKGVCESAPLALEELRGKSAKQATKLLNGASIEHLYWEPGGQNPRADFTVGIVEFDDQGNEWNAGQISKVKEKLGATFDEGSALVVVFVHGWKNNCEACNGNLACFRETLAQLAAVENRLADALKKKGIDARPRKVFGLYVAWRGASTTTEPAKEASFFSRKSVADRVGSSRGGTLTNLLAWVSAKRNTGTATSPLGDMVALVGHSFGADVLYGTIANGLDAAIASSRVEGRPAEGFGDLAILVNPAFEASAYVRFAEYAKEPWPEHQLPLMVTVQARNDWATHYTFPAGRTISTLPQASSDHQGYRAMIDALGHHSDFYTHSLDRPPVSEAVAMVDTIRTQTKTTPTAAAPNDQLTQLVAKMNEKKPGEKCACDGSRATNDTVELLLEAVLKTDSTPVEQLKIGSPMLGVSSYMTPCGSSNLSSPLLMVRADPAIVDGHNGITRAEFFDFLANFLVRVQKLRAPQQFKVMMTTPAASSVAPTPGAAASAGGVAPAGGPPVACH
jgi:hypothetical protein